MQTRKGKAVSRILVIAIAILMILPASVFLSGKRGMVGENDFEETIGSMMKSPTAGSRGGSSLGSPIDTISKTIEIPAGKQYYIYFDNATKTLMEMQLPDLEAGLPQNAKDAIDRAPNWLHDDLAKKFGELANVNIDVGGRSTPTFADIDGDGDLDLIVGESGGILKYYENVDKALHYYEGTDFFIGAVYVENASMFSGIDVGTYSNPTFGDLDGDNDLDILIGASDGKVYYYKNTGNVTNPAWSSEGDIGRDVGTYSTPYLVDLDNDGDYDLVIGAADGKLYYSQNSGANPEYISDDDPSTTTTPVWDALTTLKISSVDIDVGDSSNPALADMDDDGDYDLTVGKLDGTLNYYENTGTPESATWADNDATMYSGIDAGDYSAPALADLDFNYCYDLGIGANDGTIHYYENTKTASDADWLVWANSATGFVLDAQDNYYEDDSAVRLKHRTSNQYVDKYADLINDPTLPNNEVDELAFSIAHTATSTLKHSDVMNYNIFRENADYIYSNAADLPYVEIKDYGNYESGDYWSTANYTVNISWQGNVIRQFEYPREIYYEWIVLPKVGEEYPRYTDPHTSGGPPANPPTGVFWRNWYFNHADDGYPLLKDLVKNSQTLWNCTGVKHRYNYDDNGALGKIGKWVNDTIPNLREGSEGSGDRQPERVAGKHNGMCDELSTAWSAAGRACLIPVRHVTRRAEDHLWNEFWERNETVREGWHNLQNDRGGGGLTVVDEPYYSQHGCGDGYGMDPSGIWTHRGDDYTSDVLDHFTCPGDRARLTIHVKDVNGNPVDGAKVSFAAWYYFVAGWVTFGSNWNYTDADGNATIWTGRTKLGGTYNDGIQAHVSSKYGGGTVNGGYENRYIIEGGVDQYHEFTVGGTIPRPDPPAAQDTPPAPGDEYKMEISYEVNHGMQFPSKAFNMDTGTVYHPQKIVSGNHVDSFIVSSTNLTEFLKGYEFGCHNLSKNSSSDNVVFEIPATGNWYYVLSNQDTVETTKIVNITVNLYEVSGDLSVEPPTNIWAELTGANYENVTITWTKSADDGGGENDVAGYDIYYNQTYTNEDYNNSKTYTKLASVDAGVESYVHKNDGLNTTDSYYYIIAKDENGNTEATVDQAGKIAKGCVIGWNFISDPYLDLEVGTDITEVLKTLEWDIVRWWDSLDTVDHWKCYASFKPSGFNDFLTMNRTMGIWVNVTSSGDYFVDAGRVYENTTIQLYEGWNQISYASFIDRTVEDALSEIWSNVEKVEGFDENNPPYYLKTLAASDWMEAGCGYWIRVTEDCTWTIEN